MLEVGGRDIGRGFGPPRADWEPWWASWEGEKEDVCGIRVDKYAAKLPTRFGAFDHL